MSDQQETGEPQVSKAAMLLMTLDKPVLAGVLKHLNSDELSQLMREYERETRHCLPGEEQLASMGREFLEDRPSDASNHFKDALVLAFGQNGAERIARRDQWRTIAERVKPERLATVMRDERPEAVAIVLLQLPAAYSADVLVALPEEMRALCIERLTRGERVPGAALDAILCALEESFKASGDSKDHQSLGLTRAAAMLNRLDLKAAKPILKRIRAADPARAAAIEQQMFHFEDLCLLDNRTLQRVLTEIKPERLAIALKGITDEQKAPLMEALPDQVRKIVVQEMEDSGKVPMKDVIAARNEIAALTIEMDQAGKIRLRPDNDAVG
jgi:flagellar motor switch protein FliG